MTWENKPETMHDSGRNFRMRIAGMIMRMCAFRNVSIDQIDAALFEGRKLERFLNLLVNGDGEDLTLQDLASITHYLQFDIELSFVPKAPQATTGVE